MDDQTGTIELFEQAIRDVEHRHFAKALWSARELTRRRFSGGFEVAGRVFIGLKKHEKAIRTLRAGVAVAPRVSALWHWLGTACSDHGDFNSARNAFLQALGCDHVRRSVEPYNLAVVEERAGDVAAALEWLSQIELDDTDLPGPYLAELRARLLIQSGRLIDAESTLEEGSTQVEDLDDPELRERIELRFAEIFERRGDLEESKRRIHRLLQNGFWGPQVFRMHHRLMGKIPCHLRQWKLLARCDDSTDPDYEAFVGFIINAHDQRSAENFLEQALGTFSPTVRILEVESAELIGELNDVPGVIQRTTGWHRFAKGT